MQEEYCQRCRACNLFGPKYNLASCCTQFIHTPLQPLVQQYGMKGPFSHRIQEVGLRESTRMPCQNLLEQRSRIYWPFL